MAKKLEIRTNKQLQPIKNNQETKPNPEVYYRSAQNSLAFFTPENAPSDYQGLKKEVKELEKIHSQSFIILAHRLKLIRDKELYKQDGYEDFKSFIENELDLARRMVYNYIKVLEVFGVHPDAHDKITSLVKLVPYVEEYPDDREQLLAKSRELSRRDLEKWLKDNYKIIKEEETEKFSQVKLGWCSTKEELFSKYKFLRQGMKPKTLKEQAKGILNYLILEEPNNNALQKLIKDFSELEK